uniref:Mediator of RNA polymerase II transcription subunit 30 n=1 Tax=Nothobranchius kadleci TaxID=1051664 RepID=A0A1A8BEI9_NOTKA
MTTPPLVPPFGGQPPHPPQQQQQQAQAARDVNTSSLCRYGEETVQDIVLRTMEIFQLLRNMQLPNGVTYHPNTHQDRLGKLQEHLRMLSVLFRKLRLVYDKCSENCAGLDPIPPEKSWVLCSVERLIDDDYTIEGYIMLVTSGCAVVANIVMAVTLHQSGHGHSHGGLGSHGHSHAPETAKKKNQLSNGVHSNNEGIDLELNQAVHGKSTQQANASVRAAFVHVMGDLLQSVSVLISAIVIFFKPEYKIADPICTFLFSILVLCTTFTILRDILLVLMEGTPSGVKYSEVRDRLLSVKGVTAVHNLHIWALTMNQAVLSAHVAVDDSVDAQTVLREMTQACFSSYNFHSITIQMEQQADLKPGCLLCENPQK